MAGIELAVYAGNAGVGLMSSTFTMKLYIFSASLVKLASVALNESIEDYWVA